MTHGETRRFVRSGATGVMLKVAGAAAGFVVAVLLARALGPREFGVYSYAFALTTLLAIPAQLGLPQLVLRETARAHADRDWARMRGVWRWSSRTALAMSAGVAVVAGALAAATSAAFDEAGLTTFAWALLLVPLVAATNLRAAALRGLQHLAAGLAAEHVVRQVVLAAALVGAWWVAGVADAAGAMALHAGAAAAALAVAALWLRRAQPPESRAHAPVADPRGWLRSAWPLAIVAAMHLVNTRADTLMLGMLAGAVPVGLYQVAVSGANALVLAVTAFGLVAAPQFAAQHAAGDRAAMQRLATRAARAGLALTAPAALVLIAFGGPLIEFVFGAAYRDAYAPLAVLACGQVVNAAFGPVGMMLNMAGHERTTARAVAAAAAGNVLLNLWLIPRYGMTGAAAATAVTMAAWNVALWRAARQRLAVDSFAFPLRQRP